MADDIEDGMLLSMFAYNVAISCTYASLEQVNKWAQTALETIRKCSKDHHRKMEIELYLRKNFFEEKKMQKQSTWSKIVVSGFLSLL